MASKKADPCIVIIFGASGDLARRKLIPALYELHRGGHLPDRFAVLGVSRTPWTDEQFRQHAREFAAKEHGHTEEAWNAFARRLHYQSADGANSDEFPKIKQRVLEVAAEHRTGESLLFYLSVAPQLYERLIINIGLSGLVTEGQKWCSIGRNVLPWQRIVIEKPFGSDLESAAHLNRVLGRVFEEEAIFRIDHYLGKETVQNLLVFRFANAIFEPLWNRQLVDHIQITAAESLGVEGRGAYYDRSGALRDMIQSHLLQLMAAVAMEAPNSFRAFDLRTEQRKVLEAVTDIPSDRVDACAVRGQYGAGPDGPAYVEEKGVAPDSTTETYAAMRLQIDNWRWQGVPFYLRTGKRLRRKLTQIVLYFKPSPYGLFRGVARPPKPNRLVINVQPDEGISLRFEGKVPGQGLELRSAVLDFDYVQQFGGHIPEAYAHLLLDAMLGDRSLFKDRHEIEAAWRIATPVLNHWAAHPRHNLHVYEPGSWGPEAANALFEAPRMWHNPEGQQSRWRPEPR